MRNYSRAGLRLEKVNVIIRVEDNYGPFPVTSKAPFESGSARLALAVGGSDLADFYVIYVFYSIFNLELVGLRMDLKRISVQGS
jgi:hypothetical protein